MVSAWCGCRVQPAADGWDAFGNELEANQASLRLQVFRLRKVLRAEMAKLKP